MYISGEGTNGCQTQPEAQALLGRYVSVGTVMCEVPQLGADENLHWQNTSTAARCFDLQ